MLTKTCLIIVKVIPIMTDITIKTAVMINASGHMTVLASGVEGKSEK